MQTRQTVIPVAAKALALGTLAGLGLVLALTPPATAQQRSSSSAATDLGCCPEGWRQVSTPPVSGQLRCLPGTFVRGSATDPSVAERKPELFCPIGWKPAGPPVNRQLRCLPDQIVSGGRTDAVIVEFPASPRETIIVKLPQSRWDDDRGCKLKGIEGSPIGTVGAPGPGEVGTVPQGWQLTFKPGATKATVPMKHGSCGLDCGTHVLTGPGSLSFPVEVGMTCPAGTTVVYLAAGDIKVLQADSGNSSFSKSVDLQPWSAQALEQACQTALGGSWGPPDNHNNSSPTANTALSETIKVSGRCSGWANTVYKDFQANLDVACTDEDFYVPVP